MDEKKTQKMTKMKTKNEVERENEILEEMEKTVNKEELPKKPKLFKKWQAALLIGLTLLFSIGGGITLGNSFINNDLDVQRVKEQLAFYEQRIQIDPNNFEYRVIYAYSHYLLGNHDAAIKELNWVLNQNPSYYDAHLNLGIVYLDLGRLDEAMFSFNEATKIAPRDFKGFMYLGRVYTEMERYDDALNALSQADELSSRNVNIIYNIGYVGEASGDYVFAESVYREALQYDPMFEEALEGLSRVQQLMEEGSR